MSMSTAFSPPRYSLVLRATSRLLLLTRYPPAPRPRFPLLSASGPLPPPFCVSSAAPCLLPPTPWSSSCIFSLTPLPPPRPPCSPPPTSRLPIFARCRLTHFAAPPLPRFHGDAADAAGHGLRVGGVGGDARVAVSRGRGCFRVPLAVTPAAGATVDAVSAAVAAAAATAAYSRGRRCSGCGRRARRWRCGGREVAGGGFERGGGGTRGGCRRGCHVCLGGGPGWGRGGGEGERPAAAPTAPAS